MRTSIQSHVADKPNVTTQYFQAHLSEVLHCAHILGTAAVACLARAVCAEGKETECLICTSTAQPGKNQHKRVLCTRQHSLSACGLPLSGAVIDASLEGAPLVGDPSHLHM